MAGRKAVFIDRDGTLSQEIGYIHAADLPRYALLPNAAAGLKRLRAAGYALVVLTNQSGVARGYFPASQVDAVHARLKELLAAEGAGVDAVYYCPHQPGLALRAAQDLGLDLGASWMLGDKAADLGLAEAAGLKGGILVRTGYGEGTLEKLTAKGQAPQHVAADVLDAAELILRQA
jgi:D-glycero-D-manno-heptose 1,7-bisphosphate phosphatase